MYIHTYTKQTMYIETHISMTKTNKFILNLFNRIYVSVWSKKSDIRYILL